MDKQKNEPRRIFLPLVFLGLLAVLCVGTFVIHAPKYAAEIPWVMANCQTNFVGKVDTLVDRWEADAAENLFLQERLVEIDGLAARVFDKHFVRDTDYSYSVVRDNHNWLQFITFNAKPKEILQHIDDYQELGVPIVYVQPPTKYIEGYSEFPATLNDQTAVNVAATAELLAAAGVPRLDLRGLAEDEGLDKEQMFYRTDHHWRVETAFWANARTIEWLNEEMGWEIDKDEYYRDLANWLLTETKGSFLGSQGRRVGRFFGGVDDFTLIEPNFDTDFAVTITKQDGEVVEKQGSFSEVLLDWDMLNDSDIYTNRYGAYWGADYPTVCADNLNNDDGKRVLIIKDSYSLPYGAFMATALDELYMVDLRYFDIANLAGYIERVAPDVVLIMYS